MTTFRFVFGVLVFLTVVSPAFARIVERTNSDVQAIWLRADSTPPQVFETAHSFKKEISDILRKARTFQERKEIWENWKRFSSIINSWVELGRLDDYLDRLKDEASGIIEMSKQEREVYILVTTSTIDQHRRMLAPLKRFKNATSFTSVVGSRGSWCIANRLCYDQGFVAKHRELLGITAAEYDKVLARARSSLEVLK